MIVWKKDIIAIQVKMISIREIRHIVLSLVGDRCEVISGKNHTKIIERITNRDDEQLF